MTEYHFRYAGDGTSGTIKICTNDQRKAESLARIKLQGEDVIVRALYLIGTKSIGCNHCGR